jgi:hypothetical protein
MRAHFLLLGALTACTPEEGKVTALWQVGGEEIEVAGAGEGKWCPASGRILVDATEGDRAVGVLWHFDSLVPASYPLGAPTGTDSGVTGASAAARYVHLDEVRGYRSLSGQLTVKGIDSTRVSGEVTALLQRIGEPDSINMTMIFKGIRLAVDSTVCGIPTPAPDTQSTSAPPEV